MTGPDFVPLGSVAQVDSGPAFKSALFQGPDDGIRLVRGDNIEPGALRWDRLRTWPHSEMAGYEHLFIDCNDLILGMDRPVISSGLKLARVRQTDLPALLVQRVARIRPHAVDREYLYHWLSSPQFGRHLQGTATGTQLPHVTLRSIREYAVPRFGVAQERRIVELLENHLSRLDAADAYLDASRSRLIAMERSALARCSDGQLRQMADVTAIQGGIQKQQKRAPNVNAFPFLRVANVTARGLELQDVHRVELFSGELDRLRLQKGDLLVVEGNGSASQIGRAAIWDGSIEDCVHQNHLIRVRPREGLLPEYLEAVWNSPLNRARLSDVASSSSGLHTLSVSKLKQLSIAVPSIARQRKLVNDVIAVRDAVTRLRAGIAGATTRRNAVRRSLLAAAFSGRLTGTTVELSELVEMIDAAART